MNYKRLLLETIANDMERLKSGDLTRMERRATKIGQKPLTLHFTGFRGCIALIDMLNDERLGFYLEVEYRDMYLLIDTWRQTVSFAYSSQNTFANLSEDVCRSINEIVEDCYKRGLF